MVMEEEEVIQMPQLAKIESNNKSIAYIILMPNSVKNKQKNMPTCQTKLYGKSILEWVSNACAEKPTIKEIESNQTDIINIIKPDLTNSDWTIILYSDTPLVTSVVLDDAVKYAETKDLNVLRLERGYVCKTEYLKHTDFIYGMEEYKFNKQDFTQVITFADCTRVSKILKQRIMDYYMENGVQIIDPETTYIESSVSIGEGTIIYPSNIICGTTEIGDNVQLFGGNRILNSIISAEAKIEGSSIISSVIGSKSRIKNSVIGSDTLIKSDCKIIDGASVKESVVDEECKIIGASVKGSYVNKNCKIYDGARVCGEGGNIVLLNNVSVAENAVIARACEIKEGSKIGPGAIIK
ncbi:MAG: hypothetical protein ACI4T8_00350 [Christensenellales bacterium]